MRTPRPHRALVVTGLALAAAATLVVGLAADTEPPAVQSAPTTTALPAPVAKTTTAPTELHAFPLTGLEDVGRSARPVLAIKVDNSAPARPQLGLEGADVVVEELVEGGLTRFMALYHSTGPATVGPVRSVRPSDGPLLAPLGGLFASSGGIAPFVEQLRSFPVTDVSADLVPSAYRRDSGRSAPNNLFADTAALWPSAPAGSGAPPAMFRFRPLGAPATAAGAVSAGAVDLRFSPSAIASYVFDAPSGRYLRFQDGRPHLTADLAQLGAANVVVQQVDVVATGYKDVTGVEVPTSVVVGTGDAWVFTSGKVVTGRWSKPTPDAVTTYVDQAGVEIPLTAGQTWVHLLPVGETPQVR